MTAQEMAIKLVDKFGGQAEAAKRCGVSQGTLSLMINGKLKDTKASTIAKLKAGLKIKK